MMPPRVISAFTRTAIEVRTAELLLWLAVIEAGAQPPEAFNGLAFAHWPAKDRQRVLIRAAVLAFPTAEVRAKERTYTRLRDACIKANIGLVYQIAEKLRTKGERLGLAREDLVQEGVLGMARALETFDSEAGTAFATYSYFWIYHHMNRSIENSGLIRVPTWARSTRTAEAKNAVFLEPLDSSSQYPTESRTVEAPTPEPLRLYPTIDSDMDTRNVHDDLRRAVNSLPSREATVIRGRFFEEMTLAEVGSDLGVSRERVRQIEAEAISKLEDLLG